MAGERVSTALGLGGRVGLGQPFMASGGPNPFFLCEHKDTTENNTFPRTTYVVGNYNS